MSSKLKLWWASGSILLALTSQAAWAARSEGEIREAISGIIAKRHPNDTAETWKGLGPGAPAVIISMYRASEDIYEKARLVGGLAWFPESAEAVEFLKSEAGSTDESIIRQKAIRSLSESQGEKEEEFISKFLGSSDAQTRVEAAEALKRMGDSRAKERLEAYLKTEKATWIVSKLRGEPPPVPTRLVPVASSEDRAPSAFEGEWKGLWLRPDAGSGFSAQSVEVRIEGTGGAVPLRMRIKVPAPGKPIPKTYDLANLKAKGTRLSGSFPTELLPRGMESASFEAELAREGGGVTLVARSPGSATLLVLRKSGS